jgi:integrase
MQAQTVLDAYQQFSKTEACQANPKLIDNLRTALRRCVLPYYKGFAAEELRTNLEGHLAQIPLAQLLRDAKQLLELLERGVVLDAGRSVSKGTITNYRSVLLRFFNWMYTQGWNDSTVITVNSEIPEHAPAIYGNQTLAKSRQERRQLKVSPYALKEEELTQKLKEQLEQLQEFWTKPEALNYEESKLSKTTFIAYRNSILCILGWHRNIQEAQLSSLKLEQVAEPKQFKAFIDWGIYQRGNGTGWAINMTLAAIAVAKWLFSQEPVSSIPSSARELQNYLQVLRKQYHSKDLNKNSNEKKKNDNTLTFEESVQVVQYLKQCCASRRKAGRTRSESAILRSWQRYLITALLIYSPIRPGEIQQLEYQRSLFRKEDGYWVQFSSSKSAIGKEFLLPSHLTQDLDKWLKELRSKIQTEHNFVFIRTGSGRIPESLGHPLTARDTSELVATAIHSATSILFGSPKRGTPHVLRNIAFTHLGRLARPDLDWVAELTNGQLSHESLNPANRPIPKWDRYGLTQFHQDAPTETVDAQTEKPEREEPPEIG